MSDIPSSVFHEILIRLPADTLARSRSVSKTWRELIDDTVFLKSHLQRQIDGENILIRKGNHGMAKLYSISLPSLEFPDAKACEEKSILAKNVRNLNRPKVTVIRHFPVVSCHGFVLLSDYDVKKTWAIWNPFTGEFLEIPDYSHLMNKESKYTYVGFGYDSVSEDYKVVKVNRRVSVSESVLETLVFSVKLGSWKRIEDYPYYVGLPVSDDGAFYNGKIHWFKYVKDGGGNEVLMILSLDLAIEKYREILVPIGRVCDNGKRYPVQKYLDGLGGCLLFSCCYEEHFDVWVLEDGMGKKVIWRKLLTMEVVNVIPPRVVSYVKTKEYVIVQNGNSFWWFDVGKKCEESNASGLMWKVGVKGVRGEFSAQAFPVSLIKLKGSCPSRIVKGKLKRKRKGTVDKKSLELKLKYCDFRAPSDPKGQVPSDDVYYSSSSEEYDASGRFYWYGCA